MRLWLCGDDEMQRRRRMASALWRRMSTLNVNVGILGHVDSGKTSLGVWPSSL